MAPLAWQYGVECESSSTITTLRLVWYFLVVPMTGSVINNSCTTIYNGVFVQSYLLILVNVVLFSVFKFFVENVLQHIFYRCWYNKEKPEPTLEQQLHADVNNALHNLVKTMATSLDIEMPEHKSNRPEKSEAKATEAKTENSEAKTETEVKTENAEEDDCKWSPHYDNMSKYGKPKRGYYEGSITGHLTWSQFFSIAISEAFKYPKAAFFYIQAFSAIISIVVALVDACTANKNSWNTYQDFYGVVLNSSFLTFCISLTEFGFSLTDEKLSRDNYDRAARLPPVVFSVSNALSWFSIGFLLPPFFTHIIPAVFLYCWIFLIIGFGTIIATVLVFTIAEYNERLVEIWGQAFENAVMSLFFRYFWVMICIVAFDLAYFFYHNTHGVSPIDYIAVVISEYDLRTQTLCLLRHYEENAQNYLILFSWL